MSHRIQLRRTKSQFGRIIPKPERPITEEKLDDTPAPIQEQIEGLRTKIALKERYNRVIQEDVDESRLGATACLQELFAETRELRSSLIDALEAEQTVVQHALRLYRAFQLAMTNKPSTVAIPWLKDKLFDLCKTYSLKLYQLVEKRKKLDEAEKMVVLIEKMPVPGSLDWEKKISRGFYDLENKIEIAKAKGTTAQLLSSRYLSIKYILREESGKYYPILKLFENQFKVQASELKGLQKMLRDANKFREDADKDLKLTEKESIQNRKYRRTQMTRIRKIIEQALQEGANKEKKTGVPSNFGFIKIQIDRSGLFRQDNSAFTEELLKQKVAKIDDFVEGIRRVLSVMRIDDVKMIPTRCKTIEHLSEEVTREANIKVHLRDTLLLQKVHLYLIQCNLRFSGEKGDELFAKRKSRMQSALKEAERAIKIKQKKMDEIGNIFTTIRVFGLSMMSTVNPNHHHHQIKPVDVPDLKSQLKSLYSELSHLTRRVHVLRTIVGPQDPKKDFSSLYKPPSVPKHHIRVGSPLAAESEGESDDDHYIDSKIPGPVDIKSEGKRLIRQAIISKGLH